MDTLYEPSEWGKEYHSLPHREALGAGAAGPGKTTVLIMEPFHQIQVEHERCADKEHPYHQPWGMSGGWALFLRRTHPMLEQIIARTKRIFPRIDTGAKFAESTYTWHFSSGFRYQFGHCRNPDDWEIYYSNEYSILLFDELSQFEEEQYQQITSRLRSTDPVLKHMLKVRSMSNPLQKVETGITVKDPHWVRRRFVDPAPQGRVTLEKVVTRRNGEKVRRTRIYLPATLYDNPDPEFVEQYEAELLDKPAHIRKALLEGDWYVTPGSYFGDVWDTRIHTVRAFHIPDDWLQWRSMDWGFKQPGCVLWYAMDPEENIYVHREYTFQNRDVEEVGRDIRDIEKELGLWGKGRSQIIGPGDDQIWEERGDTGKSKAAVMAQMGIHWTKADKSAGSRQRGAERIHKLLGDHHKGTTQPGVVFFDHCRMCILTIPGLQSDPKHPEKPIDGGDDHWFDALRYGVSFASHGRAGIPPRIDDDDDDDDERLPRARMGRYGYGSPIL